MKKPEFDSLFESEIVAYAVVKNWQELRKKISDDPELSKYCDNILKFKDPYEAVKSCKKLKNTKIEMIQVEKWFRRRPIALAILASFWGRVG